MYWVWLQKNEEYLTGTVDCTTFGKLVSVLRLAGLGIASVSNSDFVKRFSSWLYCCLLLCAFNSPYAAHNNSHNGMLWTIFDLGALVMNVRVQIFVMRKEKKMVVWDTDDQIQVKTRLDKNVALLPFYLSGCQGGPKCWSPSPTSHGAPGTKSFFPWIKIHLRSDLIKHQGDVDLSHTSLISGPSLIRISPSQVWEQCHFLNKDQS